jgi:concanavalin A-like lectin/glucanase superfamily protein
MPNSFRKKGLGVRFPASCLMAILCGVPLGCGADDPFAAETDDEYTEPLTNAVIGSPKGVTVISPSGESQVAEAPAPKGGVAVESGLGDAGAGGGSNTGEGKAGASSAGSAGSGKGGSGNAGGEFPTAGAADPGSDGGFGLWHFDDCSPTSHFMLDSSGLGAHAQQALKAACVPGLSGLGVKFRSEKDVVQVPDQPQFTIDQHVGVAAWVNPKTVSGNQPIVIKRLNNKTSFSLGIHNGNIEMSVVLSTGKTIISRAPIAANRWTHVAGMYDGTFVFLFINGQQFGQVFGAGTVRDVFAPIRIGATTQKQFFNGTIDEVFLTTQTITPDALTSLACVARPSTLSVNPAKGGPVPPDTAVHYDVSLKNNDLGACQPKQYSLFFNRIDPGISATVDANAPPALPGTTVNLAASVTGAEDAEPGVHQLPFVVFNSSKFGFEQLNGQLNFELAAPTGCFVRTRRELMITDVSVVDDPVRAAGSVDLQFGPGDPGEPIGPGKGGSFGAGGSIGSGSSPGKGGSFGSGGSIASAGSPGKGGSFGAGGSFGTGGSFGSGGSGPGTPQTAGVWSFGHLMREMATTPEAAPAMTLKLLQHWLSNQNVNGFTVQARPAMQQQLIDLWPKTANGELDLDQSPLTLQAIVNRIDVRNLAEHSAGEGRFVYGVNGGSNFQNFTVIVEYNLVAHTEADVTDWANRWHALGALPFPSEQYNAALEAITRRFTDHGASPGSPNGSALVELRTNEIALSSQWELRSFVLSPTTGLFAETTVKETPDLSFNNTPTFANFVNQNAAAIIAEVPGGDSHTVPLEFEGKSFMGGSVFNNQELWNGPGITDSEARFHASLNTCNGCHSSETGTKFLMVIPRFRGSEAQLSPFMTGISLNDPFTGQVRTLNDLARRRTDLASLVCASTPPITNPVKSK